MGEEEVRKDITPETLEMEKRAVPIFAVKYDPETDVFMFCGYAGLGIVLTHGLELEKYVCEKIGRARRVLVTMQ